ncbi:uncharacterized protein [Lepeophtheirus salmonis]|uniref:uncharacterized protein isoform X1 n=1 Tax=Lepeophtheirus salmonis TaxID=72036 RepID=UPI001AE7F78E|nr:uncharacterized protein LOC121127620 isoform X1 [Lepeophtheirus salmonis]
MSSRKILIRKLSMSKAQTFSTLCLFGLWLTLSMSLPQLQRTSFFSSSSTSSIKSMDDRIQLLRSKCRKYSDPFRPEKAVLFEHRSLGVEVVHFPTPKVPMSVCIPHKTGSKSWGIFSRQMKAEHEVESFIKYSSLNWKDKSALAYKIVVVRHPLERLVSVYRMIFEDWCNPEGIPYQRWKICSNEIFNKGFRSKLLSAATSSSNSSSSLSFLNYMYDSYRYTNDLYMFRIWEEIHPHSEIVSREQLKFTFKEFIRFLIEGSEDPFISGHKGVSYHWAPIWKECSLCSPLTTPDFVLHLETLSQDLRLLERIGKAPRSSFTTSFPHAHDQNGSQKLVAKYYSMITKDNVRGLVEKYKLDHELFGYDPEPYIKMAQ